MSSAATSAAPARKGALPFILITVLLDMMGIGLIIPVLPKLVTQFLGGGPAEASMTFGWLTAIYALTLFLAAPLWGALSDKVGRRPIILITLVGATLDYVLMAMAPSLWLLFLGRALAGACGANVTTANAYIADVTPPEKRAQAFGLLGAAFGIGFVLGPALGGLLGSFGPRVPFWAAAILTGANLLYGLFVLPESLAKQNRRAFNWRDANPLRALWKLTRFKTIALLAAAFFLLQIAGQVPPSIWVLYTDYRFGWDEKDVGLSLAAIGVLIAVVQGGLTRPIVGRIGERRAMIAGFAIQMLAFIGYGLAGSGWIMLLMIVPHALGGIAWATSQSIVSQQVAADQQGELQGAMTALTSVAAVIGPILATAAFGWSTLGPAEQAMPGLVWFAGAGVTAIAVLLTVFLPERSPQAEVAAADQAAASAPA